MIREASDARSMGAAFTVATIVACAVLLVDWGPQAVEVRDLGSLRPDRSYMLAQVELFRSGAQYGRDIVWTYGPLGFVLNNLAFVPPEWAAPVLFVRLGLAVVFGWGVAVIAAQATMRTMAILLAAGMILCAASVGITRPSVFWLAYGLMAAFDFGRDQGRGGRWFAFALAAAAAVSGLVKFTHLLFGGLVYAGLLCVDLSRGRVPWRSLVFTSVYLAGWKLCGQEWSNLPEYVVRHWGLTNGYSAAMSKGLASDYDGLDVALFVVAALIPLVTVIGRVVAALRTEVALAVLVLGAWTYLANSHAWGGNQLEASARRLGFGMLATFAAIRAESWRRILAAVIGVACVAAILVRHDPSARGMISDSERTATDLFSTRYDGIRAFVTGDASAHRAMHDGLRTRVRELAALPVDVRGTVDFLGDNGGVLSLLEGIKYRPRPMFLSLNAHNERLAEDNRRSLAGLCAPEWLITEAVWFPIPIFDRRPMLNDGPCFPELFARYDLARRLPELLVFRRREVPRTVTTREMETRTVAWSEWAAVPENGRGLVFARWSIPDSTAGRLWEAGYRRPRVLIDSELADGQVVTDSLVPRMAAAGFVISPSARDNAGLANLALHLAGVPLANEPTPVRRVRLRVEGDRYDLYAPVTKVCWSLQAFSADSCDSIPDEDRQRMELAFLRRSVESSLFPAAIESIAHARGDVLSVHAPSRIRMVVPPRCDRVTVGFGLKPSAWTGADGKSDGATFRVSAVDPSGQRQILLEHRLDPAMNADHRRPQSRELPLVSNASTHLILETDDPRGNSVFDHTYWSAASFHTPRSDQPAPHELATSVSEDNTRKE
jgi:hypothetical protein